MDNTRLGREDKTIVTGCGGSRVKLSHIFITALSVVSIVGFLSIISETLFSFDLSNYAEAALMLIIGAGMVMEANLGKIKTLRHGLNSGNFTHLTTAIIGAIAIVAGIFSIPYIRIETPGFLAVKGIISIIAIMVIVIQTWFVD